MPTAGTEPMLLYLVKQVELAVRSHLDNLLRPAGLTALQYTALTVLERHRDMSAAQLAFYLSADRLPVQRQWSRKHAHTQRRLCERFAVPVIGALRCRDITTRHMQEIVNAARTPGRAAGSAA